MPPGAVMGTIHFIQHLFGTHLHPLFLFFTGLGTSAVLWPLLLLYYWLVDPVFARRLSIAFAASLLANRILKEMFNTERPFQIDQLVSTPAAERTATGHGFPSGHSQNAATFYFAFAFRYPRRWIWITAGVIVLLVGLSRLYLGVHMPQDVGGGFILGAIFAWAAGGWSGLRVWRPSWNVLIGALTLVLAFAVGAEPGACGLLAGCVAANPGFTPPGTAKGRIGMVLGGAAAMGLVALLLYWLPGKLSPDIQNSPALAYLLYLAASLMGFGLWPRVWQLLSGAAARPLTPQPLSPIPPPTPAGERGAQG
jgi:membrane-associated phospholipid phosphatase